MVSLLGSVHVFLGKAAVVLIVVSLDQFAVYHLFATACTGDIVTEIRMRATEITKHGERLYGFRNLFLHRNSVQGSACDVR